MLAAAATAGAMTFSLVAPALAQTTLATMCFRNRTIQVPNYLVATYQRSGATQGPCGVSPQ